MIKLQLFSNSNCLSEPECFEFDILLAVRFYLVVCKY